MLRFLFLMAGICLGYSCSSEEQVDTRSSQATEADRLADSTVQTDTGQIGPVPTGLVGGVWDVGPCERIYETGEVRTTQSQFKASGLGELSVAVSFDAELDLQVDFSLCEPSFHARAMVFVVDTSESMRSSSNLGNDPISGGSCGRLRAIKAILDSLPPENNVQVGFVTFSTDVDKDSGTLVSADEFRDDYLNTTSLCHTRMGQSGFDTNYTAGLGRAEDMLDAYTGLMASQEVYLITDGLPTALEGDGRVQASRLRDKGLVGTLMLGNSNDSFLRTNIASKKPDGSPVHTKASNAAALSAAMGDTVGFRAFEGLFSYKTEDVDNWVDFQLDPELTFFHANGILRSDYAGPLEIKIEDIDENGVIRTRRALLDVIRRDP